MYKLSRMKHERKGFTLIEMVVAIIILGIVTFFVVKSAILPMTRYAKVRAWNASMDTVKSALSMYAVVNGEKFPDAPSSVTDFASWASGNGLDKYIDRPVEDPFYKNITVGIGSGSSVTAIDDKSLASATGVQQLIGYTVSDGTDIEGNTFSNGQFTLTWKIGNQSYTLTSNSGQNSSTGSGSGS